MTRIAAGEIALNVAEAGQGPPLLFVHGFPLHHGMWKAQLADLSDAFRTIAPDLRGFGESDVTGGTVTMEQFADDLAALLDGLGIEEPVALCGLSMGGYIAWPFVRKYPDRLRALILCDTRAGADTPETAAGRRKSAETVLVQGAAPIFKTMRTKLFAEATLAGRPELVEEVRQMMLATPREGIAAALRGMAERGDVTAMLGEIGAPTLVLVGSEDAISPPEEMREVAAAIPDAQFVEIPGAGHMAPMEAPEPVNRAIRDFLSRLPQ